MDKRTCPDCNGELCFGYGLAFGGIGSYEFCADCDYFFKEQDEE